MRYMGSITREMVLCLDSIQGVITETTPVWSSIVGKNWKIVKDISELHAFLSLGQSGGDVGITELDLMVQVDNKIITSGITDKTDNIVVSTTSTQLSEGDENGDSGGSIDFQI